MNFPGCLPASSPEGYGSTIISHTRRTNARLRYRGFRPFRVWSWNDPVVIRLILFYPSSNWPTINRFSTSDHSMKAEIKVFISNATTRIINDTSKLSYYLPTSAPACRYVPCIATTELHVQTNISPNASPSGSKSPLCKERRILDSDPHRHHLHQEQNRAMRRILHPRCPPLNARNNASPKSPHGRNRSENPEADRTV